MTAELLPLKPLPLLVGHSPRAQQIHRLIDKLGRSRWPVLLLGETGTGKEVVARSIYNLHAQGPFVTIDCSSIVGQLMESELFGYVKGAFTGANTAKTGLIEAADGGTAFFDEIGELPLDVQGKLLRVLQQKEFRPVGSLQQRQSDFRIIAATNRDLAQEVEKGNFRRDLYYRLNIVTLRLAPLRERREDIPALVDHFLTRHGKQHRITSEVLDAMMAYEWPGNIRELENCVQHMIALNSGPLLHTGDLPTTLLNLRYQQSQHQAPGYMPSSAMRPNIVTEQPAVTAAAAVESAPHPPAVTVAGASYAASAGAGAGAGSFYSSQSFPSAAATSSSFVASSAAAPVVAAPAPVPYQAAPTGITPLVEVEKQAILQALAYTKGDRAVAASLLGIGRTTLYRKLKEYQLPV